MARLTKEEHDELMNRLMGEEQSDEMDELIRKLRDDFDESLRVDKKEVEDEEDKKEDKDKRVDDEGREDIKSDGDWKVKYDDLYKKYKERFLDVKTSGSEIKEEQREDIKDDDKSTDESFETLFKEKEKKSYGK